MKDCANSPALKCGDLITCLEDVEKWPPWRRVLNRREIWDSSNWREGSVDSVLKSASFAFDLSKAPGKSLLDNSHERKTYRLRNTARYPRQPNYSPESQSADRSTPYSPNKRSAQD